MLQMQFETIPFAQASLSKYLEKIQLEDNGLVARLRLFVLSKLMVTFVKNETLLWVW